MQRETVSGSGTADEPDGPDGPDGPEDLEATVARWKTSLAREFPRWYAWQGVAGHYYARVPRTSPPLVVRAPNAEDLRDEITRAELFGWPLPNGARLRDHCA
jgi:hypothetical protein